MRGLLAALALAQACGILLADLGWLGALPAAGTGAIGLAVGLVVRRAGLRGAAAVIVAAASGSLALAGRLDAAGGPAELPEQAIVEAVVARIANGSTGARVELDGAEARGVSARPVPERLLLRLPPDGSGSDLEPGARVRAQLRLERPVPVRNPGGRGALRPLARRGVGAIAEPSHPALSARFEAPLGPTARLHRWRSGLNERLASAGDGSALLRALALGDPSALPQTTREQFARLGIAHLLAVSGLHLALVAGGAYTLVRRPLACWAWLAAGLDARGPARVAALAAAFGYALLCGFGIPVRRAWILLAVLVASAARARRGPVFHPLWLAALAVLATEPQALFAPGAQLSFAACASLVWCGRRSAGEEAPGTGPRGALARAIGTSAAAAAATAPLAAWHFGEAAPFALVVNLVAIPWTGLVLLPAALLSAGLAALPPSEIGMLLIQGAAGLARATLFAGSTLAELVPAGSGARAHPLAIAAATTLALLALWTRKPALRGGLAVLLALLLAWTGPAPLRPAPPRLVAFDVGRGDSVLLEGRRGALLVDAGAAVPGLFDVGRSVVVPGLRALGVERLDRVVASHADLDHRGGLEAVLRAFPVGELWLPHGGGAEPDFAALLSVARGRDVPVREVGRGSPAVELGDLRVTPLWPPEQSVFASRNERSLALRVELAGRRVLLLGDLGRAERALLEPGVDLRADVLLLPHHGSAGSSSRALLAAVSPALAILSAPCPSRRGLPHPAALERSNDARASLWWTGREGAVGVGLGARLHAVPFPAERPCAARAGR